MNALQSAQPPAAKKTLRVLYAEDMGELRAVIGLVIGQEGHQIECEPDGVRALERIVANPERYDLIISDHHMPQMNGLELVRRLRKLPFLGKILIFSSELGDEVAAAYRQLKVDGMLYKPVDLAVLRRTVSEL